MSDPVALTVADLDRLLAALSAEGYRCVGPTVRDGAIVYDDVSTSADLPRGWTDHQDAGQYRLERRHDAALFGYAVGPHSWKKYLFPAEERLWRLERTDDGFSLVEEATAPEPHAFIGVRGCELAAIAIQDRVFTGGAHVDGPYATRRARSFIVAINCTDPGGTCFCVSMRTGPEVGEGYDIALTEVVEETGHRFLAVAGSARGAALLDGLACPAADRQLEAAAKAKVTDAAGRMGRTLDTDELPERLAASVESRRWEEIAARCLACANCTSVCPTCFCSSVEDTAELDGAHAERWRRWDSCFNPDFSYLYGGEVRRTTASRYRQWLTHKLSSWHDQFGTSGCVGCGRCISWCPVGIDITAEATALREEVVSETGGRGG